MGDDDAVAGDLVPIVHGLGGLRRNAHLLDLFGAEAHSLPALLRSRRLGAFVIRIGRCRGTLATREHGDAEEGDQHARDGDNPRNGRSD